jgi:hypothetical protein
MSGQSDHETETQLSGMWANVYRKVRELMHPHHWAHEPGGHDEVRLPLGFLLDVTLSSPTTDDVLVYDGTAWVNGAGGGGTPHQACAYIMLPQATGTILGEINLSSSARNITKINYKSDGAVIGSCSGGGSFSFSTSGGEDSDTVTASWSSGARLSVTISSCGTDGTYLIIDWLVS